MYDHSYITLVGAMGKLNNIGRYTVYIMYLAIFAIIIYIKSKMALYLFPYLYVHLYERHGRANKATYTHNKCHLLLNVHTCDGKYCGIG